ncbi:MAG: HPr(Ser) kinase/phosphatase [Elusimicrobiota bacterium]
MDLQKVDLTVDELLKTKGNLLKLKAIAGKKGVNRVIRAFEVNRPGLALLGQIDEFRAERIQVIGRGEEGLFKKCDPKVFNPNLERILTHKELPCFIITWNMPASRALVNLCNRHGVPLLQSSLDTAHLVGELTTFLEERLAPMEYVHGVLVGVYGLGLLLTGESGIGKSECALELLKRGHLFVADDLIRIKRFPGQVLIGEAARREFAHYVEVRGLGIIDVTSLFGIGSVMDRIPIELVVSLEVWERGPSTKKYERVGLEDKTLSILGVDMPHVKFPVYPGRNLAILIEVASLNQRLRNKGINIARDFQDKLLSHMNIQKKRVADG